MDLGSMDLNQKVDKKEFKQLIEEKQEELGSLQRALVDANIPVDIIFDGWTGSGKGEILNAVLQGLDARGFKLHSGYSESRDTAYKPFFWQYWRNLPAYGQIAIFERSCYHKALLQNCNAKNHPYQTSMIYSDINNFEAQLAADGHVIIKLFLHVSKKQIEKRLKQYEQKNVDLQLFDELDAGECKKYQEWLHMYEDMLRQTNTAIAPWYVIEAEDVLYAKLKAFDTIIRVLKDALSGNRAMPAPNVAKQIPDYVLTKGDDILKNLDLTISLSKSDYKDELKKYQDKLQSLQFELIAKRIPMIILFEGSDAAGKGGAIKRLTQPLDPRGYYVTPISAPKGEERTHHYLWRFWRAMPAKGQIAVFDRTWYGRVLVERVEGFATDKEWQRAYGEINDLESQLVHENIILVKFWLQIDKDEQLKRFTERQNNPARNWKITDEDWRNREKWDAYELAQQDMFAATNTTVAPWHLIAATCKYYARVEVLKTVVKTIEEKLASLK